MFKYLLLFILCSFEGLASDKKDYLWVIDDTQEMDNLKNATPVSITSATSLMLLQSLPDYRIELATASLPRIKMLLFKKEELCILNRIKTPEREEYSVFSQPVNLYPGLKLYYLDSKLKFPPGLTKNNINFMTLPKLFEFFPDKILGLSLGRSYGKNVDKQIAHLSEKNVFIRIGQNGIDSLKQMLIKKRVDFIIEYPADMKIELNGESLGFSELANNNAYILGYIACSKTEKGHQMVKDINQALSSLYALEAFYHAHTLYIEESYIASFKNYFNKVFPASGFEK